MLTLGHGSRNADPIQFTLKDNQNSDTTFLKLLVSTQKSELDTLEQNDAFEDIREMALSSFPDTMDRSSGPRGPRRDVWDAQLASITYTRPHA